MRKIDNDCLSRHIMVIALALALSVTGGCGKNEEIEQQPTVVEVQENSEEDLDNTTQDASLDVVPDEVENNQDDNNGFTTEPFEENGYSIEEVQVTIPNCTKEYKIVCICDLHMVTVNDEVASDQRDYVQERQNEFTRNNSIPWETTSELIEESNADAVLLGGDILDFCSQANMDV